MSKGMLAGFSMFAVIVGALGVYLIVSAPQNDDVLGSEERGISMAEVALHNSKEDCWTVIDGKVYELNSFILSHPGGDKILEACGVDATEKFNTQGGEGFHSAAAKAILAGLQIGTLE
ncbi:MAG: cytochrome b5 domain-containing protein [Candidatus Dojkabacteria bacterium]|nr:MAG: cytochrome b5 domain-containing protein [Candidatus Dojkabacteria bacterium]